MEQRHVFKVDRYPKPVIGQVAQLAAEDVERLRLALHTPLRLQSRSPDQVLVRIMQFSPQHQTRPGHITLPPRLCEDMRIGHGEEVEIVLPRMFRMRVEHALREAVEECWEDICAITLARDEPLPELVELVNSSLGHMFDMFAVANPSDRWRGDCVVRLTAFQRRLLGVDLDQEILLVAMDGMPASCSRNLVQKGADRVLEILIGKRRLHLRCEKDAPVLEGSGYVRAAPEVLRLLGIEEWDQVRLSYRDRAITCRVLSLQDEGTGSDPNVIRVPSTLRRKLGIDPGSVLKAERDRFFLLRKHLNLSLIPIFGAIISVTQLSSIPNANPRVIYPLAIISAPVMLFLALSRERAKVK